MRTEFLIGEMRVQPEAPGGVETEHDQLNRPGHGVGVGDRTEREIEERGKQKTQRPRECIAKMAEGIYEGEVTEREVELKVQRGLG